MRKAGTPLTKRRAVEATKGLLEWLTADESRLYVSEYLAPRGIGRRLLNEAASSYPQVRDYMDQASYLVEARICRSLTDPANPISKPVAELLLAWLCDWRDTSNGGPTVTVNVANVQQGLPTASEHELAMARIAAVYGPSDATPLPPGDPPRKVPSAERARAGIDNPVHAPALLAPSGSCEVPESRIPRGVVTVEENTYDDDNKGLRGDD